MEESEDGETKSKIKSKVNVGLDNQFDEHLCWSNGCVNSCGVNAQDCAVSSNGVDSTIASTAEDVHGTLSTENWNLKKQAVIDCVENDTERLVNCECFLENSKVKNTSAFSQDQQYEQLRCNNFNDNGHIRDCSYVSVLSSNINKECDNEFRDHCNSKMKNIGNNSLIDEMDFASETFDEHHGAGEICNERDILCECDLQVNFSRCNSRVNYSNVNFLQVDVEDAKIGENVENCLMARDVAIEDCSSGCVNQVTDNSTCLLDDLPDHEKINERFNENLNECVCDTEGIYDCPTESNELLSLENDNSSFDSSFSNGQSVSKDELLLSDEVSNAGEQNSLTCATFNSEPVGNDSLMDTLTKDSGGGGNYQDACEENVYEEIQRSAAGRKKCNESDTTVDQTIFKRGSLVDEVMNEVERVEKGHAQILQELNLDIENLIMPNTPTTSGSIESSLSSDLSPDLLQTVNIESTNSSRNQCNNNLSTRTLPPLPANSNETIPLLRSTPSYRNLYQTKSAPVNYQIPPSPVSSSSGVKQWFNRISSLSSFREKKSKLGSEKTRWRLSLRDADDEPVYMLYDDSHRMHEAAKYEPDDEIYEDIDNISQTYTLPSVGGRNVQLSSYNKDKQSASTAELNEDFSDTDSIQSTGSLSVSRFKGKILNFGRKLSRQSDDKGKEIKAKLKLGEIESRSESKLTRLFSKKKGYDLSLNKERDVVSTTSEEEQLPKLRMSMRQKSPILPPVPPGLAPDQIKRRYIIGTLVHSENSYIDSLKKLVNEYKKPLEESSPPILSPTKVATLFYRIPEILQCHINFCISLAACIRKWDKEETMGDVFVQAFSKTSVLDIYSDYINNFSIAVDLAKQETKRKSAFTDFLKVKQITSQDRLSLFGLMVKPVQRFPQFILLLQDLLKHTPQGHHDRLALQLALTQMETLTDILNERKRESDQAHAVKDILSHVSAKTAAKSLTEGSRHLLRQDSLTQLVFNQNGQWKKSKVCRLFLLNDLLVCVTVGPSSDRSDSQKSERYTFKWSVPVNEIEIQEEASPILSNMVYAMSSGHQTTSSKSDNFNKEMEGVNCIYRELSDLLHDFEVMSRIMALVATLKKTYPDISKEIVQSLSQSIQQSIQKKDDEVKWIDSCCLQFSVPLKSKTGKIQRELMIFQSKSMDTKQEWLRDVRMSQLALDANNSPAWNIPESSKRSNIKAPLFVNAIPILSTRHMTEVKCGCCHRTMSARLLGRRSQDYVWLCSTDGVNSYISIHTLRQMGLRDVYRFDMTECRISTMESVPGFEVSDNNFSLTGDTVWMGTESRRVLVYSGSDVDHYREVGTAVMSASVLQIKYHLNQVYIALANGTVVCFRRENCVWQMKDFQIITLSSEPVTCLLPVHNSIFCGCGRKVWIIDCKTNKVIHNHSVQHDHMGSVYTMAHSGIGLWLNLRNTPLVCLYHAETFQHLQDVNISSSIRRILAEQNRPHSPRNYSVTALTAILGLLWIGTNVGVVLSIPLPRLQGLPILGRRANLAYHANIGPVSIILDLKSPSPLPQISNDRSQDQEKDKMLACRVSNPFKSELADDGLSQFNVAKTLPRGWKPSVANIGNSECNIYGLYGNLINVREGTDDQSEDELRRSDPDLIPSLVSTLDRRLRLHSGRPRSLDLANLANLVSGNDASCVSSSSEDGGSISLSYTDLPACNMSICSQIAESPETNKIDEECLSDHHDSNESPTSMIAVNSSTTKRERIKTGVLKEQPVQRSVMTLIGGRGYIDLRKSATNKEQSIYSSSTSSSAYAILWELKV